ncbi:MAG: DUF1501 domain-containing protein [Bacteroidia bacterium]
MKRRQFLRKSATAASVPFLLGGIPLSALGRNQALETLTAAAEDRVLVLIQLNGGNDGLNTVIPIDQYSNLSAVRSNILIPEAQTLGINAETALHPSMTGIKSLYDNAKVGIIQSVGYPDPNFSHFRSTDIWTSGSPATETWETGWLGRVLDMDHPNYPDGYPNTTHPDPLAVTIGSIVSTTCQGLSSNLGMAINDPAAFQQLLNGGTAPAPNSPYGDELTFLRQTMNATNEYLSVIQNADTNGNNLTTLFDATPSRLGEQLKIVSRLISGGLKTKIFIVSMGGYDTHANQADPSNPTLGKHAELLAELSSAVEAFQDDLQLLGIADRVLGMTFSEFGRRIKSNDSDGTDHGAAAPLFLIGNKVNPQLLGVNPTIPAVVDPKDSLPMQYDFRSVYGSVLMDWFCIPEETVKNLLFEDFQHLPILTSNCFNTSADFAAEKSLLLEQNYPNPFKTHTSIRFESEGGQVLLQLFDGRGSQIATLADTYFPAGSHEISIDGSELTSGVYYCRMQHNNRTASKMLIRQ